MYGIDESFKDKKSKRKKTHKKVRWKESVTVFFLPDAASQKQWMSRFGIWKEAPFHDELWDGYLQVFRQKILTKRQLVKVNKEYKWRRRLHPKLFTLMFERGKKKKLFLAKDEFEIYEQRILKIEEANEKLESELTVERMKQKKKRPKATLIKTAEKLIQPQKGKEAINNVGEDTVSRLSSKSEEAGAESVPRSHRMADFLDEETFIKSTKSFRNKNLQQDKTTVISAYEKYEAAEKKRESIMTRKTRKRESQISFQVEIEGHPVSMSLPNRESFVSNISKFRGESFSSIKHEDKDIEKEDLAGVDKEESNLNEPTISNVVWALGQAVSSFFFNPQNTDEIELEEDESDADTIDNLSIIEKDAEIALEKEANELLEKSSAIKDEERIEIVKCLNDMRGPSPQKDDSNEPDADV